MEQTVRSQKEHILRVETEKNVLDMELQKMTRAYEEIKQENNKHRYVS